jgi:hypothetical protein
MYNFRQIPIPEDTNMLEALGALAMPLHYGREFDEYRSGEKALDMDDPSRDLLRAELDARVARLYKIEYEELQHILSRFPGVSDDYKQEVLYRYKNQPIQM